MSSYIRQPFQLVSSHYEHQILWNCLKMFPASFCQGLFRHDVLCNISDNRELSSTLVLPWLNCWPLISEQNKMTIMKTKLGDPGMTSLFRELPLPHGRWLQWKHNSRKLFWLEVVKVIFKEKNQWEESNNLCCSLEFKCPLRPIY